MLLHIQSAHLFFLFFYSFLLKLSRVSQQPRLCQSHSPSPKSGLNLSSSISYQNGQNLVLPRAYSKVTAHVSLSLISLLLLSFFLIYISSKDEHRVYSAYAEVVAQVNCSIPQLHSRFPRGKICSNQKNSSIVDGSTTPTCCSLPDPNFDGKFLQFNPIKPLRVGVLQLFCNIC